MSNKRKGQVSLISFGFNKASSQEPTAAAPTATPAIKTRSNPSSLAANLSTRTAIPGLEDNVVGEESNNSTSKKHVPHTSTIV